MASEVDLDLEANLYRTLADLLPTLCWMARSDGWIYWYNHRWYDYTGTTPAQMEGWGWQSVHDPASLPAVLARWRASLALGEPFEMVFPLKGADGTFRPFLTRIVPIRDQAGRIIRWFGTNTDIAEQVQAEAALRARTRELEALLETVPTAVWFTHDPAAAQARGNAAAAALLGVAEGRNPSLSAPTGERPAHFRVFMDGAEATPDRLPLQRAARGEEVRDIDQTIRFADGRVVDLITHATPLRDEGGRVVGAVAAGTDITGRKRAEAKLRGQNRILDMVARGAPPAATLDALARFVEAQEPGLRCGILLVAEDGGHFRRGSGPGLPEAYHAALDGVAITPPYLGSCGESAHRAVAVSVPDIAADTRYAGQWRDLLLSCGIRAVRSTPVRGSDGRVLGSLAMYYDAPRDPAPSDPQLIDIATHLAAIVLERGHAERRLRESEARLRVTVEAAGLGTWEADLGTGRNLWDAPMAALLGLTPEQGARLADRWPDFVHPADRNRVMRAFLAAAGSGAAYRDEFRVRRADGAERVFATSGVLIGPGRMVGAAQDVTEARMAAAVLARDKAGLERLVEERTAALLRAHAGRERAEAAARQAEKLAALGQLAGGIAHDFNNVLQAVWGGASLIRARAGDPASVQQLAGMVEDAARRGTSVTRRLLAFARRDELRAEPVDVPDLLGGLREVLAHTLGAGITIELDVAPGLPAILADRGQLEAVLVNLATNARDAMAQPSPAGRPGEAGARPEGGTLTFSARLAGDPEQEGPEQEGPAQTGGGGVPQGASIRLAVIDTGVGMDAATLARASEPFFTTKPQGRGTGLGLAMARGFAEQSGGALRIDSAPGRGTIVALWLPAAGDAAGAEAAPPAEQAAGSGTRAPRILLVDDEDPVRDVLAGQLSERGYEVVQARDGAGALDLLRRGGRVDLLVSDLAMPGMDGVALIREAQRRTPRLPAILLTGYAGDAASLAVGAVVSGPFGLVRKPVRGAQLADRVAALLAAVS